MVEVNLLTGRTHQIRVHFCSIQHPVVGDEMYGFKGMNEQFQSPRMFLHAWKLKITHPKTGEEMEFESELPEELEGVLKRLRS